MTKSPHALSAILLALSTMLACAQPSSQTLAMEMIESGSTGFALKLFTEETKGKKENILLSPFSAYAALSMTLNGAAGKTRQQMAKALGVSADSLDKLNARNQAVFTALNANDSVQMEVANAIFADKTTHFKKEFIELCKQSYSAEVQNKDFSKKETVTAINNWCSTKTHGKISEILSSLTPKEKMVLLNAIYFKGAWKKQFGKSETRDDQFLLPGAKQMPIKMMHQHLKGCMFAQDDKFQAIALPYAGAKQNMYIFLPNKGVDITAFQAQFTEENWNRWMHLYNPAEVNVSLPRFKINYMSQLNDTLKAVGMSEAFIPKVADFSNMVAAPDYAWISRVLQKIYMDVNEEGTEAAAVTAVVMGYARAMAIQPQIIDFRVDRPFVLAIVDNETNEILFLGTIIKPEK